MASCLSKRLNPDAPLFTPQAAPPPQPMVMPCPFMGPPPPPPGLVNPFHCLAPSDVLATLKGPPPPPGFSSPFLGPPPPPGFTFSSHPGFPISSPPPMWGFPKGPAAGPPMPHVMISRPAAPAVVHKDEANAAALKDGEKAPAGSARGTWRAGSGRRRPRHQAPGHQRAANLDDISPRSVLDRSSPPVLPAAFPYSPPAPSSPPPTIGQPMQPLPPKQVSCPGGRHGFQRPRRRFDPASCRTTLMIRNIPNGFTREKVVDIIDQHCAEENAEIDAGGSGVKSEYDFVYVPFDFGSSANKGYCFVNVTSPDAAFRLWKYLHGYRWKVNGSRKVCEVDYADIQGREDLVAHFSSSCFDCDTEDFLPVWFSPPRNGVRPAVLERHVVGRLGRR